MFFYVPPPFGSVIKMPLLLAVFRDAYKLKKHQSVDIFRLSATVQHTKSCYTVVAAVMSFVLQTARIRLLHLQQFSSPVFSLKLDTCGLAVVDAYILRARFSSFISLNPNFPDNCR